ncbi:MAG: HAMP domain-containing histidine kinase [Acidaminococcales bacterium]|jgi:signal transduction histidine kinase|nr:HAMP domain-containing histidine kinase [Acidaminococcales bacterium]
MVDKAVQNGKFNSLLISCGVMSMFFGFLCPFFFNVENFGVITLIYDSIANADGRDLFLACLKLVIINTVRIMPVYISSLLLMESFGLKDRQSFLVKFLPVVLIPFVYYVIELSYNISYHFGVPAVSLILAIIIVNQIKAVGKNLFHKIVVFALMLFGMQWLDIVPALTEYGFGQGEISLEIKKAAAFGNFEDLLNIIGGFFCLAFVFNAIITAFFLRSYTNEINSMKKVHELERVNDRMKIAAIDYRTLLERQMLVHDLKTPLTAIQGLAGVLSLSGKGETREYAEYISGVIDKMKNMINEILQDEASQIVSVQELLDYACAHVPRLSDVVSFKPLSGKENLFIKVNRIKMARAIINILENAIDALEAENGQIEISAGLTGENVEISIFNNGPGIDEKFHEQIWQAGFSTKRSSGLGLVFVKDIVAKNSGQIQVTATCTRGVKFVITLPRCEFS